MLNGTGRKRSWSELLAAVKQTRSLSGRQSSRTPNNFTFSDTKLYFLALPEKRSEYTLFYVVLKNGEQNQQSPVIATASWHLLLDLDGLRPFQGFSREEQLLRERKRMGSFGITSYEYDKNSRSILFPACSSLYMCKDHVLPSVSKIRILFPVKDSSHSKYNLAIAKCLPGLQIVCFQLLYSSHPCTLPQITVCSTG